MPMFTQEICSYDAKPKICPFIFLLGFCISMLVTEGFPLVYFLQRLYQLFGYKKVFLFLSLTPLTPFNALLFCFVLTQ